MGHLQIMKHSVARVMTHEANWRHNFLIGWIFWNRKATVTSTTIFSSRMVAADENFNDTILGEIIERNLKYILGTTVWYMIWQGSPITKYPRTLSTCRIFQAILDIWQTSKGQFSTLPFQADLSRSCLSLNFAILKGDVQWKLFTQQVVTHYIIYQQSQI